MAVDPITGNTKQLGNLGSNAGTTHSALSHDVCLHPNEPIACLTSIHKYGQHGLFFWNPEAPLPPSRPPDREEMPPPRSPGGARHSELTSGFLDTVNYYNVWGGAGLGGRREGRRTGGEGKHF